MLFYTNYVIFACQTYIVKPIFSNHCPRARMGKLPPWGSLPIDGGVGWAIIMILLVSVPVEGLLKKNSAPHASSQFVISNNLA